MGQRVYLVISVSLWGFSLGAGTMKGSIFLLCRGLCEGKNVVALRK